MRIKNGTSLLRLFSWIVAVMLLCLPVAAQGSGDGLQSAAEGSAQESTTQAEAENPAEEETQAQEQEEQKYYFGGATLTLLPDIELSSIEESGDGYTYSNGVITMQNNGILSLTGESDAKRFVIAPGADATLFFKGVKVDSANQPVIEVRAGATLTLSCTGSTALKTDGSAPAIRIANGGLVHAICHEGNSLLLDDGAHSYYAGNFYTGGNSVRFFDPDTGLLTRWTPQPVNEVALKTVFDRAMANRTNLEDPNIALHFYNYTTMSGQMQQRLVGLAEDAGVTPVVYAHTISENQTNTSISFSMEKSVFYKGVDLRSHYHSPETIAVQQQLERLYENNLKVICLREEGDLGREVKVELQQHAPLITDMSRVAVYTYNPQTESSTLLANTTPTFSAFTNIFVTTRRGGYLIVSDGALVLRPEPLAAPDDSSANSAAEQEEGSALTEDSSAVDEESSQTPEE